MKNQPVKRAPLMMTLSLAENPPASKCWMSQRSMLGVTGSLRVGAPSHRCNPAIAAQSRGLPTKGSGKPDEMCAYLMADNL